MNNISQTKSSLAKPGPFNSHPIGVKITNAELSGTNLNLAKCIPHSFRNDTKLGQLIFT